MHDLLTFKSKKGKSPLHLAARYGHLKSFKLLLHLKASLYSYCRNLDNVLHRAVKSDNLGLIKFVSWCDPENNLGEYQSRQKNWRD